jgi:hypothetical protein
MDHVKMTTGEGKCKERLVAQAKEFAKVSENRSLERLCEDIGDVFGPRDV